VWGISTDVKVIRTDAGIEAEMRLESRKGKSIKERMRNIKIRRNLKINNLEQKLKNNRIRWYGHILRVNKEFLRKFTRHQRTISETENKKMGTTGYKRCHTEGRRDAK
jgi:hypothetical protein